MYTCDICTKNFTRKDNLIRHLRKFHDNGDSLKDLLKNLETMPPRKRTRDEVSDSENETMPPRKRTRDEVSDSENEEGSIASVSSSEDEIEDQLNGEDILTPSMDLMKDVWEIINDYADRDYEGDVVRANIDQVRIARRLKKNAVHKKVMETVAGLQERDYNMDFEEALLKAANRRKYIIEQAAKEAVELAEDEEAKET